MTPFASISRPDRIEKSTREENAIRSLPASYAQKRIWLLEQWSPGEYNIGVIMGMTGRLDHAIMERVVQTVIQRHEILRTVLSMQGEELVQIIHPSMPFSLSSVDLSSFQADIRRSKLRRITQEEFRRPFDLQKGPLIRVTILKTAEQAYIFLLTIHHSISDGWSMETLYNEITTLYTAYYANQTSPLPELTTQYADYANWQNEWLKSSEAAAELDYWKEHLRRASPLELPFDHPRLSAQGLEGESFYFALPRALSDDLKALSRKEGVTLFMTLLTAWKVLFYRYTGNPSITIGTVIAGRLGANLEKLIGCLLNTLALHSDLSGSPTFRQVLKRVRSVTLEAYDHQTLPFERLTEEISPERDMGISPLTQLMFSMQNVPGESVHLPELVLSPVTLDTDLPGMVLSPIALDAETLLAEKGHQSVQKTGMSSGAQVADLDIWMWEKDGYLMGSLKYNASLFELATIGRMQMHFQRVLEEMVAQPDRQIDSFSFLLPEEEYQILNEWNDTQVPIPSECFQQLFEKQVACTPTALAVSQERDQLTYSDLNQRANRLAWHLRSLGVGPDIPVALLAERGIDFLVAVLGVFKAGGAYLPLDRAHPPARLREIVEASGSRFLLTTSDCLSSCAELAQTGITVIQLEEMSQHDPGQCQENPPALTTLHNLAYIIYTSGSTGKPKGVMIEHQGMLNHLYAKIETLELAEDDCIAQTASQCFDISVWQFLAALLVGGSVRIYSNDIVRDPTLLFPQLEAHHVTILEIVPSLLNASLSAGAGEPVQLEHMRWLVSTGEALSADLCRRWLLRYPAIPLVNAYGPTECSDDVTQHVIYEPPESTQNIPIGLPLMNTRIYVLDQQLTPLPIGVKGEIYVGGLGVGRGYLHDSQRTDEAFIPDPFSTEPGSRLYKTGDLGRYLSDGTLEFLRRIDHQVKVRGYRIELGEIEAVLRTHPAVQECIVQAHEYATGNQHLIAYLVAESRQKLAEEDLRALIADVLPTYMHPSVFMQLEALPLTENGKLDRQALPLPELLLSEQEYIAPETEIEVQLAQIWEDILGVKRVGINDDFFALGGQSLLLITLMAQIQKQFAQRLPLALLFRHRTIASVATILSRQESAGSDAQSTFSALELQAEVQLPMEICPEIWPGDISAEPATIFLTGATGFLGVFLLAELLQQTRAEIFCLVRATSLAEGWRRLKENLSLALPWQAGFENRIKPVVGDLMLPMLGLTEAAFDALADQVESIYHCGALVNTLYPYPELKPTNVLGTQEMIRLATHRKIKTLHYISTLSIFSHRGMQHPPIAQEQDSIDDHGFYLHDGYAQSKWAAEKMVTIARSRGLPVAIYRPGLITGHSQTGAWRSRDTFGRITKGCISLGYAPLLLPTQTQDMAPVDYVSQAIVALSRQKAAPGQAFHLYNPVRVNMAELVEWINEFGYPLQSIPYARWYQLLAQEAKNESDNPLVPLFPFLPVVESETAYPDIREPIVFDNANVQAGLAGTSITCPPASAELFCTYLAAMKKCGDLC